MSQSKRLQNALDKAKEKEKKCRWLEAAELYEQALHNAGKQDFLNRGKIKERIACCFNRVAFQAESQEEFKRKILQAIEHYEDAEKIFEKTTDGQKEAGVSHCKAVVAYANFLVETSGSLKRKLLDESLSLEKKTVNVYELANNWSGLAKAYNARAR